ncbi:hydrogenase expression/formation protein HypE [Vulcanisaeta distributa]|uniref:Hydrogenase expression/formation protein HypE n=1 Tax=Vulcanisaeta distributa (strain DSM 14429 / JCM 11212 / NBRC 100878 / IC-017) TaxID=572478 RepID=E1QQS5_VULDI|nr:hydrogenase expression/formation protein HypE [Vulcanisaeta distributa]ADN51687.1 hydrogenase expression/formation protein HypE [Vulcanisaeta distributa DSM 14429]
MSESRIRLAHGSGGVETLELLERLIFSKVDDALKKVGNGVGIDYPDDAAAIPLLSGEYLIVTVDAYTVNPPFFPGGNIGVLAASGSINDVLMMGGRPIAMLDSIVVEEGFPMNDLETIINSFIETLRSESVALIGGDFKVMPKGQIDRIVITTVGIGLAKRLIIDKPRPGDKIIVSDYVGDHGAVILLYQLGGDISRELIEKSRLRSDVKPLTRLMIPLIDKYGEYIHAARDPTRGGLAMALNDWARSTGTVIVVNEEDIPIRPEVSSYAGMLGIDPLYLASEGVAVLAVDPDVAEDVVNYIRGLGFENARIIGEVRESEKYRGYVLQKTVIGGFRILEPPRGDLVPRIC